MLTLTTTCETYFKVLPTQAVLLADNENLFIQADRDFTIQAYAEEREHFRIVLTKPIRDQTVWFVLIKDSKVTDLSKAESVKAFPSKNLLWIFSLESVGEYFRSLNDHLLGKSIELEVESKSRKITVNASSRQELDAAIKAAQDFTGEGAPQGEILFDTPDQMKVGIPEIVSIRITKKLTYDFFEDLIHTQEVEVENIRVSQFMAANLRGDDFKIEALGNEEQIIEDNDFTQWDWKVVPLKGGNRKLWASITIQVKVENKQARKTLPVEVKEISVKINPVYSTSNFVVQHWQWLIASAIIPIVGLLLKK